MTKLLEFLEKYPLWVGLSIMSSVIIIITASIVFISHWLIGMTPLDEWIGKSITDLSIGDILLIGIAFKLFGVFNSKVEVKK